jgi:hypothetical protein
MRNIAVMIVALALMVSAAIAQDDYSYMFHYYSGGKTILESFPDSVQGLDDNDVLLLPSIWESTDWGVTIYKENGKNGWDSDSGYYVRDARSILQARQTEVFEGIYLWAGNDVTAPNLQLQLYDFYMSPGMTYSLDLISIPNGVTYNGKTHWGINDRLITLPFITSDDPTKGYQFRVTVTTPVPEPSSILALLCGISGVGGMMWRKRK